MRAGLLLELSRDVHSCAGVLHSGLRGSMHTSWGMSLYDLHVEVPFEGIGVPHDVILVVTIDPDGREAKLPLLEWARARRRGLRCGRCGLDVLGSGAAPSRWSTPARVEDCQRRREEAHLRARLLRDALNEREARKR